MNIRPTGQLADRGGGADRGLYTVDTVYNREPSDREPRLGGSAMTTRLRVAIELAFGSAFALLLLGRLMGCAKPAPADFKPPPSPVQAVPAVGEDVPLYLDEIGRVVAREMVSVQPQVSGRITEIQFVDGADVKTGD